MVVLLDIDRLIGSDMTTVTPDSEPVEAASAA
jgi:hypothetical protein